MDTKRYTIEIKESISPPWLKSKRFEIPLVNLSTLDTKFETENVAAFIYSSDNSGIIPINTIENGVNKYFFDIKATIKLLHNEEYPGGFLKSSIVEMLPFDYTQLPMKLVGIASKILSSRLDLTQIPSFPKYPSDNSADVLYTLLKNDPNVKPLIWPEKKKYCVVFTHDVDTSWIFDDPEGKKWYNHFTNAEETYGIRSSWYCVPVSLKSNNTATKLNELIARGHEIGIHGYKHNPALPKFPLQKLIKQFNLAKDKVNLILGDNFSFGYRAPWLSRNENMYKALNKTGYLYDTSPPNADFHRGNKVANNGCCTFFPFMRNGIVVIPVTLPQDALRVNLDMSPDKFWKWLYDLSSCIKEVGGIVVVSTHIQPHHSANQPMLEGYKFIMEQFSKDTEAWIPLPAEAAKWAKNNLLPL